MSFPLLHFRGAAAGVTGSCFEIDTGECRLLVDCGLFQGSKSERELNYGPFPFDPRALDAVILTHAHIDHSGLLPKLAGQGFAGPIFATEASADLCEVVLPDCGYIQEMEVEQLNLRNLKRGRPTVAPVYGKNDALECFSLFRKQLYGRYFVAGKGVRARFWNAGHLLGSASVEIEIAARKGEKPLRLLFSGDIGPDHKLLHAGPDGPRDLDYVVCEATYGDRSRGPATAGERRRRLQAVAGDTALAGGPLIIPSFAVERTQELLVDLFVLMRRGDVPEAPIFVDSPLAAKASAVFERHAEGIEQGSVLRDALNSRLVRFTETTEESRAIHEMTGFHVIVAASGMCDAGRIRHHLRTSLWKESATVLLVGFQAQGSLGRILLDGAPRVRIQGEEIAVKARIEALDLYSGHADGDELVAWVEERLPIRHAIFLTHGEEAPIAALHDRLSGVIGSARVLVPRLDDAFELAPQGPRRLDPGSRRRLSPDKVGHADWHNELAGLLLDLKDSVKATTGENEREETLRRLRTTLHQAGQAPAEDKR